jgi:hypothetical protein
MAAKTEQKIECEEVIIKIPKAIMKFLREHETLLEEKIEDYLQRGIVHSICADIETQDTFVPSPLALANKYDLQPIFKRFGTGIFDPDC